MRISLIFFGLVAVAAGAAGQNRSNPPRLAVVISVDQMRGDYLERFAPHFVQGGFNRFREGRWFDQCLYRHGVTKTGPGHAVILTGVHANLHGIIDNDWRLRTWPGLERVNCVEDRESPLLGLPAPAVRSPGGLIELKRGRSPRHLLAPTVGDFLKEKYGANSKVFGVADKDRAAILMGGRRADGAYWTEEGRFVTSTYYRPALPTYVERFNAEDFPGQWFGKTWDRLLEPAVYEAIQGPDDAAGEMESFGLGRTFPKKLNGGREERGSVYLSAFEHSPWDNDFVAELARRIVVEEMLGADDGAPDVLAIGFSQTDRIGHGYGPDSHEVMDTMLRLDRTLAALIAFIEERVGAENCVFVLAADHGAPPLPERQLAMGVPAGRVRVAEFEPAMTSALNEKHGPLPEGMRWFAYDGLRVHINPEAAAAKSVALEQVAADIAAGLRRQAPVAAAYTRRDLEGSAPADPILTSMRLGHHAERGGDVLIVLKPYFMDRPNDGVTHGQPYRYDQHVPLAWLGAGIVPARVSERVGVDDLAPTLAGLLGVAAPPLSQGRRLF